MRYFFYGDSDKAQTRCRRRLAVLLFSGIAFGLISGRDAAPAWAAAKTQPEVHANLQYMESDRNLTVELARTRGGEPFTALRVEQPDIEDEYTPQASADAMPTGITVEADGVAAGPGLSAPLVFSYDATDPRKARYLIPSDGRGDLFINPELSYSDALQLRAFVYSLDRTWSGWNPHGQIEGQLRMLANRWVRWHQDVIRQNPQVDAAEQASQLNMTTPNDFIKRLTNESDAAIIGFFVNPPQASREPVVREAEHALRGEGWIESLHPDDFLREFRKEATTARTAAASTWLAQPSKVAATIGDGTFGGVMYHLYQHALRGTVSQNDVLAPVFNARSGKPKPSRSLWFQPIPTWVRQARNRVPGSK